MRSTTSFVTSGPSSRMTSPRIHCQTCDREISAVAASSIRLKIATAPLPPSQAARYCSATEMLFRSPASVMPPGVLSTASRSGAVTETSGRCRSSWFGLFPRTESNTSWHTGTRSGCATQEPSNPSPASRVLSSRTFRKRNLVHLGVAPGRDERGHAAHRERAALVAGLHEQLGVGAHQRRGHRDGVALGQHEVPAPGAELLDDREQVVPASRVQARAVLAQLVQDLIHLERRRDRLDQHRGPDGAARDAEVVLRDVERVVPQPRLDVRLHLRQVEVRVPCPCRAGAARRRPCRARSR